MPPYMSVSSPYEVVLLSFSMGNGDSERLYNLFSHTDGQWRRWVLNAGSLTLESVIFFFFFFFFFVAHGHSQARGPVGAVAGAYATATAT